MAKKAATSPRTPNFSNFQLEGLYTVSETKNKTEILLSNGCSWIYSDVHLFDSLNGWKVGDRVCIVYSGYFFNDEYYLENRSHSGYAPLIFASIQ